MHILDEHKKKYLNRRISEIEELKQSLGVDDFDIAINIGHRLKGNGETFGYPIISALGISLEQAGIAKDKVKLREAIKQLEVNVEENLKKIH
ncbi:MAG: Hpt domain-containing protein [Bacteriovorax sp.]|nr:Hpt domain-containing protein [Bacteriovorax sp.]